jgi:two-component system, LytTR family, response regulator
MELLKVLIADDDEGMRLVMRRIVEKVDGFALCAEARSGEEALAIFERERPQVVFLDVEMAPVDGVECAREIADTDPKVFIIFATAHDHYMKEAFEVYAFDYLVKPFNIERVRETLGKILGKAVKRSSSSSSLRSEAVKAHGIRKLVVRHKDGVSLLDADEIVLIQREERSTVIITSSGGRIATSETLSEIQERLDKSLFMRSHKSYIINLSMVYEIYPYGRWTYIAKLKNTSLDALVTHDRFEEMEKKLSGTD